MAAELKRKQECKSKWLIEGTQLAESNPSRSDHSPLLTPTHPYAPFFFFRQDEIFSSAILNAPGYFRILSWSFC